ncbi:hypothetical protein P879_05654 [Paragonimus westermani]|uniref:Uncharacterized protein n=1 Tax=Paragonimus westermani TaxID=34504 RepID=A0A8T0DM75_9TREM|nr:hypothetical protein P879_05654 [Paragonimus westermani]
MRTIHACMKYAGKFKRIGWHNLGTKLLKAGIKITSGLSDFMGQLGSFRSSTRISHLQEPVFAGSLIARFEFHVNYSTCVVL